MAQYTVGNIRGRQTYTNDGGGYSSQQSAQKALTPSQDYVNRTKQMVADYKAKVSNNTPSYGSGGGYTAQEAPSSSEGGYTPPQSNTDDILNKIRGLLEEQKVKADEYLKSQYNQALENYKNQERLDSEKANLRKALMDRRLDEMYGNSVTGSGLSNRVRSNSNWYNDIANIQRDLSNRNTTALQDYNRGLANNASTLSQGWYNYILPIYTNRQQNLDDLDYRKYVNSLFNY